MLFGTKKKLINTTLLTVKANYASILSFAIFILITLLYKKLWNVRKTSQGNSTHVDIPIVLARLIPFYVALGIYRLVFKSKLRYLYNGDHWFTNQNEKLLSTVLTVTNIFHDMLRSQSSRNLVVCHLRCSLSQNKPGKLKMQNGRMTMTQTPFIRYDTQNGLCGMIANLMILPGYDAKNQKMSRAVSERLKSLGFKEGWNKKDNFLNQVALIYLSN